MLMVIFEAAYIENDPHQNSALGAGIIVRWLGYV
jgi:hypothetical protein